MSKSLFKIDEYYVFTFVSTSHAIKAESVFKKLNAEFLMMPTLREISSSCGYSIKIHPRNLDEYYEILINNNVAVEGIYNITKKSGKNLVKLILK